MARDQVVIECPPNAWTEITDGDVTDITFQVRSNFAEIRFTVGASEPAATDHGRVYPELQGESNQALTSLVKLSGANRVWARGFNSTAKVFVDHA